MSRLRVFLSHSSQDNEFCDALVNALRKAQAEVFYDRDSLRPGPLSSKIKDEIRDRPVFLVAFSSAASDSPWVQEECRTAEQLHEVDQTRIILPVTAGAISPSDFATLPFLERYLRVEARGFQPHPLDIAIAETLRLLELTPKILPYVNPEDLAVSAKAMLAGGKFNLAFSLAILATQLGLRSYDAWLVLGNASLHRHSWRDALDAFDRCLKILPNDMSALVGKGESLIELQRFDAARDILERATRADEKYEKGWYLKGLALHGMSRFADAVAAYDRALVIRHPYPEAEWHRTLSRRARDAANSQGELHGQRRDNRSVLWVDRQLSDNDQERVLLAARGIDSIISIDTDDALSKLGQQRFRAIIIDMIQTVGDQTTYSFIEYVGIRYRENLAVIVYCDFIDDELVEQLRKRGVFGVADSTWKLIRMIEEALDYY